MKPLLPGQVWVPLKPAASMSRSIYLAPFLSQQSLPSPGNQCVLGWSLQVLFLSTCFPTVNMWGWGQVTFSNPHFPVPRLQAMSPCSGLKQTCRSCMMQGDHSLDKWISSGLCQIPEKELLSPESEQNWPAGQGLQSSGLCAPGLSRKVPLGHGCCVGVQVPKGQ